MSIRNYTHNWCYLIITTFFLTGLSGCVTDWQASRDEARLHKTLNIWESALIQKDVEKLLSVVSECFSATDAQDKAALGGFILEAIQLGYLEDVEISFDDAVYTFEDDAVTVFPIDLKSRAGAVVIELGLIKEAEEWRLVTMEIDGL